MHSTESRTTHSERSPLGAPNERYEARIRRRQTVRLGAAAVLVALVAALAIDNAQSVTVSYLFGSASAPLVVALVMTFALGAAAGYLFDWRRQKH